MYPRRRESDGRPQGGSERTMPPPLQGDIGTDCDGLLEMKVIVQMVGTVKESPCENKWVGEAVIYIWIKRDNFLT